MDILENASIVGSITMSLKSSKSVAGPEIEQYIYLAIVDNNPPQQNDFLPVLTLSYLENNVTGFCLAIAIFVTHPNSSRYCELEIDCIL